MALEVLQNGQLLSPQELQPPTNRVIVTHQHPDMDAITAAWAMRMVPGWEQTPIAFVPAGSRQHGKSVKDIVGPRDFANAVYTSRKTGKQYAVLDTGHTAFDHHQPGFDDPTTSAARLVCEYKQLLDPDFRDSAVGHAVREIVRYAIDVDNLQHVYWDHLASQDHEFTLYQVIDGMRHLHDDDGAYAEDVMHMLDGLVFSQIGNEDANFNFENLVNLWEQRGYDKSHPLAHQAAAKIRTYLLSENTDRDIFSLKHVLRGIAGMVGSTDNYVIANWLGMNILDGLFLLFVEDVLPAEEALSQAESFMTQSGKRAICLNVVSPTAERLAYVGGNDVVMSLGRWDNKLYAKVGLAPHQAHRQRRDNHSLARFNTALRQVDPALQIATCPEDVWFAHPRGMITTNLPHQRKRIPTGLTPEELIALVREYV